MTGLYYICLEPARHACNILANLLDNPYRGKESAFHGVAVNVVLTAKYTQLSINSKIVRRSGRQKVRAVVSELKTTGKKIIDRRKWNMKQESGQRHQTKP